MIVQPSLTTERQKAQTISPQLCSFLDCAGLLIPLSFRGSLQRYYAFLFLLACECESIGTMYEKPHPKKKPCIFGHCPYCDLTPPIAQIRALCGTIFLPKMRTFFKQPFWLWEWIFWQWLRSKMILRGYSDWNQGKYWWNMIKIRWLSNGFCSVKNCHKQCPNLHGFS